ncbi:MAG: DVU_1557 family redox protein [Dehalobacterium sp.]
MKSKIINSKRLKCLKCDILLAGEKININYLKSTFPAELLRCPKCGLTYVPEDLALGKILEVEKTLEDK